MTIRPAPVAWRSLLFVGADRPDRIAKASEYGADAVIVDLEDAVPRAAKGIARAGLADAITLLAGAGQPVVVRVNAGWRDAVADLTVAVRSGVAAIMAPGCADPARLQILAEMIGEWEAERGLPIGATEGVRFQLKQNRCSKYPVRAAPSESRQGLSAC